MGPSIRNLYRLVESNSWSGVDPEAAVAWDRDHPHDEASDVGSIEGLVPYVRSDSVEDSNGWSRERNKWWVYLRDSWITWDINAARLLLEVVMPDEGVFENEQTDFGNAVDRFTFAELLPDDRQMTQDEPGADVDRDEEPWAIDFFRGTESRVFAASALNQSSHNRKTVTPVTLIPYVKSMITASRSREPGNAYRG